MALNANFFTIYHKISTNELVRNRLVQGQAKLKELEDAAKDDSTETKSLDAIIKKTSGVCRVWLRPAELDTGEQLDPRRGVLGVVLAHRNDCGWMDVNDSLAQCRRTVLGRR